MQRIARIFALRDRGEDQARGQLRRHVLEAVHGQIDAAVEQRFLDFLGEKAFAADLRKRNILDLVAGGFDDFDARVSTLQQDSRNMLGLPQRELRTARADDDHLFSRRNSLRIRSDKMRAVGVGGGAAQLGDGAVGDFVDDAARDGFDGFLLLRRHRTQAGAHALDLIRRGRFRAVPAG